jgi:cytochrome c1
MKRNKILMIGSAIIFIVMAFISSCTAPAQISMKGGAQLWGETCSRCHNTASPSTFSDVEWDIAIKHMQYRAQITKEEAEKIVEFLKSAN